MNLTKDPIPKLVRAIAIPASIGMFFQTMYNFVDTYFAGIIGVEAVAALTFSFPIFFIILAFGNGLSQACTAMLAHAIGAKNQQEQRIVFFQTIVIGGIASICITLGGLALLPKLYQWQGAQGLTLEYSLQYMNVIMASSGLFFLQMILNAELTSRGNTRIYRNVLIVSFFANCILDPWLLHGGFGIPPMGIQGIAIATMLCQIGTCAYLLKFTLKSSLVKGFTWHDLKPDATYLIRISQQAFPAIFNMMTVGIGIYIIQYFIGTYGTHSVAAYGIATRVEQMILLPCMGLNYAVISLVGQNYGSGQMDRVIKSWKTTLKYGILMMMLGGVTLWFAREPLMRMFIDHPNVIKIGKEYLGVASLTLCAYVILFQTVYLLQGLKRPAFAIWIGLYRQIIAPASVMYLLIHHYNAERWCIWLTISIITWSAATVALAYAKWIFKTVLSAKPIASTPP